jgi:hypothetical protein
MKKYQFFLITMVILLVATGCRKKGSTIPVELLRGYTVTGNRVLFTCDDTVYKLFDPVEKVSIAGTFNDYNPKEPGWQLSDDDGDGVWHLEKSLDEVPCGSKYRFVINKFDWMQPNDDLLPERYLTPSKDWGYDILVLCE